MAICSGFRSELSYWALPAYMSQPYNIQTIWEKRDISSLDETKSWETRIKHNINITDITIHPLRSTIAIFLIKEMRREKGEFLDISKVSSLFVIISNSERIEIEPSLCPTIGYLQSRSKVSIHLFFPDPFFSITHSNDTVYSMS